MNAQGQTAAKDAGKDEMSRMLDALQHQLKRELELHGKLLDVAERKHQEILSGPMEAFVCILDEERALLDEGRRLKEAREKLISLFANKLGCKVEGLRLAQLMERAPEPLRSELGGLQTNLRQVLERLRDLNDRNLLLIRQSLAFVKDVMDAMLGASSEAAYDPKGRDPQAARSAGAICDFKV